MGRRILAVVVGAIVAGIIILIIEALGHAVIPPESLPVASPGDEQPNVAPAAALVPMLVGWFLGTMAGAWLAARMMQRDHAMHALTVGIVMLAAGIVYLLMVPHPAWFTAIGVLIIIPAAYLGAQLAGRRRKSDLQSQAVR